MNNSSIIQRIGRLTVIAIITVSVLACSKVNRENYDKLKMGMPYAEVVTLLGEPDKCDSLVAFKSCTWGKDAKTITIRLLGDNVVLYESQGL